MAVDFSLRGTTLCLGTPLSHNCHNVSGVTSYSSEAKSVGQAHRLVYEIHFQGQPNFISWCETG